MRLAIASILRSWLDDELLTAETGIDAHHEHKVDVLEHIVERLGWALPD